MGQHATTCEDEPHIAASPSLAAQAAALILTHRPPENLAQQDVLELHAFKKFLDLTSQPTQTSSKSQPSTHIPRSSLFLFQRKASGLVFTFDSQLHTADFQGSHRGHWNICLTDTNSTPPSILTIPRSQAELVI